MPAPSDGLAQAAEFANVMQVAGARESRRCAERDLVEKEVIRLFDRLRNPLLHYLASFGFGYADGEEVIQEAFLSLSQHLDRAKSRENLPAWLFRVAHNLALKRRYRVQRECEACARVNAPDLAVDPRPSPEEALIDRQARTRLLAVVQALAEQDRRCLFLRAEGLRYREIAEILGISLGAVSMSLSRSLARLARVAER